MKGLEEKTKRQAEVIKNLEVIVKNLEKEKGGLAEALEAKDQQIHELKIKESRECQNGCERYSKSIDEIYQAGSKHREKVLSLKSIAENQKKKILNIQAEKANLQEQVQQLEEDVVIGQKIVKQQSGDKEKLYFRLEECKKQLNEKEEGIKHFKENEEVFEKKVQFMKCKLEKTLKDFQDLETSTSVEINSLKIDLEKAQSTSKENAGLNKPDDAFEFVKKDIHEEVVKDLNFQIEYLRTRGNDIEDELSIKYQEVENLKASLEEKTSLKGSSNSLAEELMHAKSEIEKKEIPDEKKALIEKMIDISKSNAKILSKLKNSILIHLVLNIVTL